MQPELKKKDFDRAISNHFQAYLAKSGAIILISLGVLQIPLSPLAASAI